ncbi:lasso peptide biosynthesis PqqD family chaperone [Kitasatospora sp. NPDC057518]|uniref:lasso peptide biosynthesis PqqD family chaperone n=1 Tax=Kitasatospora sp. NPDC057518 TaxID=3346155 RepID=UPI00367B3E2E
MPAQLRPDVTLTPTDDGAVLLDERSGRYYQLNRTALLVLRSLLDGRTAEETAADLSARHPVTADRARADVDRLHETLRTAGLVTAGLVTTGPGTGGPGAGGPDGTGAGTAG